MASQGDAETARIPVMLLTATPEVKLNAPIPVLKKPVEPDDVLHTLRELLLKPITKEQI